MWVQPVSGVHAVSVSDVTSPPCLFQSPRRRLFNLATPLIFYIAPVALAVALEIVAKSPGAKIQDRRHHHYFLPPLVDLELRLHRRQDFTIWIYFALPFVSSEHRRSLVSTEDCSATATHLSPLVASVILSFQRKSW